MNLEDSAVASLQSIKENEVKDIKNQQNVSTVQLPTPYPQSGQIPVTFMDADKQIQQQVGFVNPVLNYQQIEPPNNPPVSKQQFPQQQPGMLMQPQGPQLQQPYQQFPEIHTQPGINQMQYMNPSQIYQPQVFQQPIMQPNPIPPQSFAVPGQNPESAQVPQPFNAPPPPYLPVMAPVVNHYPWRQGSHYVVGQPVNYQYLYYPGTAPAKALIGDQALNIPEGQQFEQKKIDLTKGSDGEGKKVANSGCHCQGYWGLLLASGFIVIAGLVLGVLIHPAILALFGVVYLARSFYICCSDTAKFLQLLDLQINPYEHTEQLQKTEPYTVWKIQCYHFESRTRIVRQRDSRGRYHIRTETYRVRVNTHSARKHITYPNCGDASPILSGLEDFRMTRIYYDFELAFDSAEVQKQYNQDRKDWIRINDRDKHYQFNTNDVLPGLITHFLSFNDKKQKFPKCLNCTCLTVLSIFLLDWILIFWFMRHSARLDYRFLKVASNYDKH